MAQIDLNADLGEGLTPEIDEALLAHVSSASIACGGHAGDELSMRSSVRSSIKGNVRVGAHPSYPDRANFGRVSLSVSPKDLVNILSRQIAHLVAIANLEGTRVEYVKPHGALYNDAAASEETASAVFDAARRYSLKVMALADSRMAAMFPGLVITEGFIDRGYRNDGTLVPRMEPQALITDPKVAAEQALRLAPSVDSLCVHSDTPNALELLTAAHRALVLEGYEIKAQ